MCDGCLPRGVRSCRSSDSARRPGSLADRGALSRNPDDPAASASATARPGPETCAACVPDYSMSGASPESRSHARRATWSRGRLERIDEVQRRLDVDLVAVPVDRVAWSTSPALRSDPTVAARNRGSRRWSGRRVRGCEGHRPSRGPFIGSHHGGPVVSVSAAARKSADVSASDRFEVSVEVDTEPVVIERPDVLAAAFERAPYGIRCRPNRAFRPHERARPRLSQSESVRPMCAAGREARCPDGDRSRRRLLSRPRCSVPRATAATAGPTRRRPSAPPRPWRDLGPAVIPEDPSDGKGVPGDVPRSARRITPPGARPLARSRHRSRSSRTTTYRASGCGPAGPLSRREGRR